MQRPEYRDWMTGRGDKPNTINTSLGTISILESKLQELGLPYSTMGDAESVEALDKIDEAFIDLIKDCDSGGERFRLIAPKTNHPVKSLENYRAHLRKYRKFLFAEPTDPLLDTLERLRSDFLRRTPDFIDFTQTTGIYYERERGYKEEAISRCEDARKAGLAPAQLGEAIYKAAILTSGGPLLRWQTKNTIEKNFPDQLDSFFSILGNLVANAPTNGQAAIWEAASALMELRASGIRKLTHGEIWAYVVTVAGLAAPNLAAPFKIQIARNFSETLPGRALFRGNEPHRNDMEDWLDLLARIKNVMEEQWDWKPRDLFDVQGFLWMLRDDELDPDAVSHGSPATNSSPYASSPENIVLYGPPGTGKTWSTAAEAVRLCEGNTPADRPEVLERYNALRDAGQVEFVTFHQSYSYEEFVEGLRPVTDGADGEGDQAGFHLEPTEGIFRRICKLAEEARKRGAQGPKFELGDRRVFKMSLGRAGDEDDIYDHCIEEGLIALGYGDDLDWSDPRYRDINEVQERWNETRPGITKQSARIRQLWRFREMNTGDLVVVTEGNLKFRAIGEITSDYLYQESNNLRYNHQRRMKWLSVHDDSLPVESLYRKRFSQASCYKLNPGDIKRDALARLLTKNDGPNDGPPDQFVLVIDEINRANISKVFGELITLIEPDKRLGQPNALSVRLPYSNDDFGVPDNLHIVATMNTADRSIALLDTALRRRFRFRELMPDPEALADAAETTGVDLVALLNSLNDRIEYLFDREHQIGHAYFIGCRTKKDVDDAFKERVIPLLTEYFYEDWDKVALVLGDIKGEHFLERLKLSPPPGLESFDEDRWRWQVRDEFSEEAYSVLT